jgi:hypothetical protein
VEIFETSIKIEVQFFQKIHMLQKRRIISMKIKHVIILSTTLQSFFKLEILDVYKQQHKENTQNMPKNHLICISLFGHMGKTSPITLLE